MNLSEATYTEELYQIPPPTMVVIATPWNDLEEKEIALLSKILGAVRLSLAHVRIIEMTELDLSKWKERPQKLIGFGIKTTGIASYEVITTPATQLVMADSLGTLFNDDDLKKKLWISLKQLFFP